MVRATTPFVRGWLILKLTFLAMSNSNTLVTSTYASPAWDVEGFDSLAELALDMRSCWNHCADTLWRRLDPVLWDLTRNPWVVLQTVARDHLQITLKDPAFRKQVDALVKSRREAQELTNWFSKQEAKSSLSCVAYFSMEFMLSETLPIYSGGLGNVAGDQLKAASDLGVPVIGVGLLYQQGYFRQVIDKRIAAATLSLQRSGAIADNAAAAAQWRMVAA